MKIIDICVDSETWGVDPGCDFRSIGGCVFDLKTGIIGGFHDRQSIHEMNRNDGIDDSFYQALDNPMARAIDASPGWDGYFDGVDTYRRYPLKRDPKTVKWWDMQSKEARAAFANPIELKTGLIMFGGWLRGLSGDYYDPNDLDRQYPDDRRLWAHGAAFDPPFLTAAYKALGLPVPFHYRAPRDTRTAFDMAGVTDHSAWLAARPGPLGINHHALDDAICEARGVIDAMANIDAWFNSYHGMVG